jgi:thiol-disulfide isomerase/thioredoxin
MSHKPTKGRPLTQSRVEAARSGPRIPVFAVAVGALAVVLVAAIVVVALVGGDDGGTLEPGDQAFGPVTATGTPLPDFEGETEGDPAIGEPAPKLEGETTSGDPITIDPADGPMVVAFLAHWCSHCQAEVPRIVEVADGSDEIEGVPFTAVLTSSDPKGENFPPGEWLAREDWPAPAMVDTEVEDGGFPVGLTAYGLSGFPYLIAIDADGNVAARSSGELGEDGIRDFFAQVADGR